MQNATEFSFNATSQKTSVIIKVVFGLVPLHPVCTHADQRHPADPVLGAALSLRHGSAERPTFWRSDRIWIIILSLWVISFTFPITEFFLGKQNPAADVLLSHVLCKAVVVNSLPVQGLFRAAVSVLFFAVVAVVILFTYVRILMETRKLRQDRASVRKALHTVLLHGLQLLLCMLAFTHPFTETLIVMHTKWLQEDIAFFNYFCFILFPRFLSPLIYGFRDQSLRKHIQNRFARHPQKVRC